VQARTIAPMFVVETCDFWSGPATWQAVIAAHPEWRPTLGLYDSADDRITDAHIAMLRSHGVSAVQACWFRGKADAPQPVASGFIESLTGNPERRSALPWFLIWDNINPVGGAVSGPADFDRTVARLWTDTYFVRPDYLRLDGKPVVTIMNARAFAEQLGGVDAAKAALAGLRDLARHRGLSGVLILTTNNADQTDDEAFAHDLGFDAVSMYATPAFTGLLRSTAPTDQAVIEAERRSWALASSHSVLPTVITASVGFDARPWSEGPLHYLLSVPDWTKLLRDAADAAARLPPSTPGHAIVLLDALNEFGEGHFIEPTEAFGTSYLDAVRAVAACLRIPPRRPPGSPEPTPPRAVECSG
jgi:hypothetical protein